MGFGWNAPSETDMNADREFTTLAEDEYIAKVLSIELRTDVANNFPSKGDSEPTHDMLLLKGEVISFADGEELVDSDGNPLEDGDVVTFTTWLNPKKRGMIPQPSKTRKAFAAILGVSVGDQIEIENFADLTGKTFIVSLKPENGYNNAKDFRPHKRVRARATTPKGPVDGEDLMKRAKEIFDEDAPDNKSPNPLASDDDDLDF